MESDKSLFPFCQNSRRWITTLLCLNLPKACVVRVDKQGVDCEYEECAYFKYKKATSHLLRLKFISELVVGEGNYIQSKEEWENMR